MDAARHAGSAPFPAAVARLRRIERDLRQRRERRLRHRAAALRRDRRRDPGRAGRHAGRRRARALHHPGHPLGEPALRRGNPGPGRSRVRRRRRGARTDGLGPPRPAGPRRLAAPAWRGTALHPLGLPGVRHRLPGRRSRSGHGDRSRRVPARARRHAGVGRGADPPAGAGRAAVIGGRAHVAPDIGGLPRRRHRTPAAPLGAARPAARTVHRSGTGALGPSDRPHLPPRWNPTGRRTAASATPGTSPCGCSAPSPSRRSGRAGAATR